MCTLPRSSSAGPGKLMPGWTRSPPSSSAREKQSHSSVHSGQKAVCSVRLQHSLPGRPNTRGSSQLLKGHGSEPRVGTNSGSTSVVLSSSSGFTTNQQPTASLSSTQIYENSSAELAAFCVAWLHPAPRIPQEHCPAQDNTSSLVQKVLD